MFRTIPVAVVLAVAGAVGCGGASVSTGKPPAPAGEQSTRTQKGRARPPRLIAPPPAYGNKIVMAATDDGTTVN